jgi:CubicO group peptidase (beta-lactamase class C family)
LYFTPGSAWRYGVSTDVLGAVIEQVVRGSLADAIAEHVNDPLGMRDTAFGPRAGAAGDPLCGRHATSGPDDGAVPGAGSDLLPGTGVQRRVLQSGGGGMVGTAEDLMTFLEAIRCGGAPVLHRDTVAMASSNQVGTFRERDDPDGASGSCPAS